MHNELFTIGPFTVYGYGLMTAIGILSAYVSADIRAKRKRLNADFIFKLVLWCVITGYIGAKLLYIITRLGDIIKDPANIGTFSSGWVVYGGIIGGIAGGILACRLHHEDAAAYFDLAMPSVALAQGFGRIGCFLAGCCYGTECDCVFSITFHTSAYAPNDVPLLPTQLISSGFNFLNFFFLLWLSGKTKRRGLVGGAYLVTYSAGRFVIEFFRGDLIRGAVGVLSTSQFISIFVFIAGIAVIYGSFMSKHKC